MKDRRKLRKKAKFTWAQRKEKGGCRKKTWLEEMSMLEMEGMKKVSCKGGTKKLTRFILQFSDLFSFLPQHPCCFSWLEGGTFLV